MQNKTVVKVKFSMHFPCFPQSWVISFSSCLWSYVDGSGYLLICAAAFLQCHLLASLITALYRVEVPSCTIALQKFHQKT